MTPKKRRETAAERDERIVAEAGPWRVTWYGVGICRSTLDDISRAEAHDAALRILNRIAKRHREGRA